MSDSIIDNELLLAMDVPQNVFLTNEELSTGFNNSTKRWELIIKYNGDLNDLTNDFKNANKYLSIVTLNNGYGIITINESDINVLSNYKQIEYIEKPKKLFFSLNNSISESCITPLQIKDNPLSLYGSGVLVGIIDSGIDYAHPDFRNDDGTTRILELWDQTLMTGTPPEGYTLGTLYTSSDINEALRQTNLFDRQRIVPSSDSETGHGTHVAGICCGNGRASNGKYTGVAPLSTMLVVKLGTSIGESFPRTTRLLEAINYLINKAASLNMPIAINISIGNNYGAHNGESIVESFIDSVSDIWKSNICIGTGNEGSSSKHAGNILTTNKTIELAIGGNEPYINMQLWKNYTDIFDIEIISPSGQKITINETINTTSTYKLDNTTIYVYYGAPTPNNILQEIYVVLYPDNRFLQNGIWQINLIPIRILDGRYDIWLASGNALTRNSRFLEPDPYTSLTIPSTASNAISVAAYNGLTNSYADFSGRGYTRNNLIKPDIAAPGVNITSAAPGGGYSVKSGTSMATPFVTGSAALLMEWGIVRNNDPFLYGEKLKAYLIRSAAPIESSTNIPNPLIGWGKLCLSNVPLNII